jgi:hypothetical protein
MDTGDDVDEGWTYSLLMKNSLMGKNSGGGNGSSTIVSIVRDLSKEKKITADEYSQLSPKQ